MSARLETLAPLAKPVRVATLRNPFTFAREDALILAGSSITQLLEECGVYGRVRVWVGDVEILPEWFPRVRPRPGSVVTIRAVAQGGGRGGGVGKLIGGIVLIVAAAVLLYFTWGASSGLSGFLFKVGVYAGLTGASLAISGLINILIPPPGLKTPSLAGIIGSQAAPESPALSVAGQLNNLRPYSVVPRVLGRYRVYPPYAARPFTETVGADQYLRLLFLITYGPCVISELRIGDTPIENYVAVETEFINGAPGQPAPSLYAVDVFEEPLSIVLTQNIPQLRTGQTDAVEMSVDWAFPEGLVQFLADGTKTPTSVSVTVEYRKVGDAVFTAAPGSPVVTTEARQGLVRAGLRWTVTAGQYDVRVTKTTADSGDPLLKNTTVWSALRTIGFTPPVLLDNVSLLAMRIKATDQLNGVIDNFNCFVEALVKDYATYSGSVLADAPLGYWRLGEILGATTAFDSSGAGRSGLYQGAPTLGAPGLIVGDPATAMTCDGTNDAVTTFTGLTAIDLGSSSFTVEVVVHPLTVTGTRGIVHKGDGQEFVTGHTGWALIRAGNIFRFTRAVGSGAPTLVDSAAITADATYHVAVVYDRSVNQARIYVNGAGQAPVTMPSASYVDNYGLEISYASTGITFWQDAIQDVAVYPTALATARVAAHAAAATGTREWLVQRSSNPASYFRDYFQYSGNARALPDARLDLAAIQAWHQENDSAGRSVNAVIDYETALYEVLRDVVAPCGRATVTINDDKFAPLRDIPQTVPAQLFTPRNSRNWSGARILPEPVHAVKVRFINPDAQWRQDERIVYDDGYSATGGGGNPGTLPATRFTVLDLRGCTDPDMAWRMGRYHIAVTRLRPEVYTLETDIEVLACRRGDLVQVEHDVVEFGYGAGRIKAVTITPPDGATGVTLDEEVPLQAGQTYGMRIRLADGTHKLATLAPGPTGPTTTVTFLPPLGTPYPAVGDLVAFGLMARESVPAVISRIGPGPEFSAQLSLVDYAPGVFTADQGTIPPYDSQITRPPDIQVLPPTPVIDAVVSDETVLLREIDGSLRTRIVITLHYRVTSNLAADYLEVRWRRTGSLLPYDSLPPLPPQSSQVSITHVEDGESYDIRLRTVTRTGATSPWTELVAYVVVGKTTRPPAPENLRIVGDVPDPNSPSPKAANTALQWDYPTPPVDLDGFMARLSPGMTGNWQTATALHAGIISNSPFPLPTMYGTWTFLVAAVDTSGNESDPPASLSVAFGDVRLHNQVATYDFDANGYPGTITNGSVLAGDLKADQVSTGFWADDRNLFWSAVGSTLFWAGTYKEMTYLFSYTTGSTAGGTTMYFDTTIVASAWHLEYRVGTSGDYLPWTGSLSGVLASQAYNFKLVTNASPVQGVVSRLTLWLDAEDISEQHLSFATAATTGTRLTLINTYRTIKTVQATVVHVGAETAVVARVEDKNNVPGANNGPLIVCGSVAPFTVVAGHADVDVTGY